MTIEQKKEICKAYAFGYEVAAIAEIEGLPEAFVQEAINEGKVEGINTAVLGDKNEVKVNGSKDQD